DATLPPASADHSLEREAVAGTELPPPPPTTTHPAAAAPVTREQQCVSMRPGNGVFVRAVPAAPATSKRATPDRNGRNNGVVFNFENQPVQAVVKAVLGDFLKRNYAIEPEVKIGRAHV